MNPAPLLLAAALTCDLGSKPTSPADAPETAAFRTSAQRGLTFLANTSRAWTQANPGCYGCHVHSVTMEGLSIGKHNRYDVSLSDLKLMATAMLNNTQGVHTTTFTTARAFGGVAFARYDQLVDAALTDDLLKVARRLIDDQQGDGSVKVDDTRFPIESGVVQATFQAMQTWRQAYARTADDVWLTPLRKAEEYLQVRAAGRRLPVSGDAPASQRANDPELTGGRPGIDGLSLQDRAYTLLGLTAAGVGSGEKLSLALQRALLQAQRRDGGWGFNEASDAFATGQVLYALRSAGLSEKEPAISRGMTWLVERQQKSGGWGGAVSTSGNSALGEAMWAVLGLVTVDVMSVAVTGVVDGQHVQPTMKLDVSAKDNRSGGVKRLELFVDDLPVHASCGAGLSYEWKTEGLSAGKHLLDVVATNAKGETQKRRFEVYAGDVYLTQLGSRFDAQRQVVEVTARDIATSAHEVLFEVLAVETKDGQPVPGKVVHTAKQAGKAGALTLSWDGKGAEKGRYFARVTVLGEAAKALHTEQLFVFNEREEVQRNTFAEVQGRVNLAAEDAANTEMELVDEKGRVVQTTRSTAQGNYRFKNVDQGTYTVRARKEGFKDLESSKVEAKPAAAPASVNMGW